MEYHNMLCLERGEHTMKKTISLLLTAIMVFSLVPALFVRDGLAADDKYVKNSTSAAINVYKEANDASKVVATLPVGGVAKYVSSNGAFLKIENPAGYVKTSQVLLQSITLKAEGGIFLYDGLAHKVKVTLTNGTGLTVEFSTDGGKTWTTKAPSLTEPGKLTVKSRATGGKSVLNGNEATLTVTNTAPVGTKITIVAHGSTTNAPVRAAATTSSAKIGSLAAGATGTLEAVSGKWVKVKVGSVEGWVYEWFVKTGTIPVEDESGEVADPSKVKLTASGGTYVYDGKTHKVTAKLENGSGYTIEYSTDGGKNWTTTVPSLTDAGKLTVKVRATGGGNIITHADVKLVITPGIPAGTDITIVAHGSQKSAPVRAKASSSAAKVGTVTAGQTGKLIKQEGAWYKVKVGDLDGYVYNWFVKVGTIVVEDD